ncbi:roadblock/LC7 domain-containing protein [Pseudomonas sp. MAP12]|uniref:Roadblock/LC7 domain-containing protein n=1 Tax=Geopseudomonas aromaticivorans TaxID=2849492 RepID=A0ABS6N0G4_9GAMM|nr:roadblock/LC7 domain-containing protein [Pseudomonas aromaticivorans]MBV2134543.1 roadblock/LC7 domain-containing protein [Pseudomonas aromaticivorans]
MSIPVDAPEAKQPLLRALCQQQLTDLAATTEGVRVAIVASSDGFPLASLNLEAQESRRITAMGAALGALSQRIVQELALGALEGTVIESVQGLVLCRQVPNVITPMVLLVVTGEEANYGYAQWAVKHAAKRLSESLNALGNRPASNL